MYLTPSNSRENGIIDANLSARLGSIQQLYITPHKKIKTDLRGQTYKKREESRIFRS